MTIQIDIDEDVQELIRLRIESGAFRDASDVVSRAVRSFEAAAPVANVKDKRSFYEFIRESPSMGSGVEFERIGAAEPSVSSPSDDRTGADLIAAIQASPYRDIDLEHALPYFPPVREVNL